MHINPTEVTSLLLEETNNYFLKIKLSSKGLFLFHLMCSSVSLAISLFSPSSVDFMMAAKSHLTMSLEANKQKQTKKIRLLLSQDKILN